MAQNYYVSFKKKLEEIFMMDHAVMTSNVSLTWSYFRR